MLVPRIAAGTEAERSTDFNSLVHPGLFRLFLLLTLGGWRRRLKGPGSDVDNLPGACAMIGA
ncbi:hypothetical protein QFZ61_000744 [Arthrobacter sp. B3I4]|nr:hypothetical protein [Arthrobacter sp. B3I4]